MSRNHYNVGPTRTAGPDRCGFCSQEWPCYGHSLEQADMRASMTDPRGSAAISAIDRIQRAVLMLGHHASDGTLVTESVIVEEVRAAITEFHSDKSPSPFSRYA